jgi:DNA-binding transcriptional LysR family regulator
MHCVPLKICSQGNFAWYVRFKLFLTLWLQNGRKVYDTLVAMPGEMSGQEHEAYCHKLLSALATVQLIVDSEMNKTRAARVLKLTVPGINGRLERAEKLLKSGQIIEQGRHLTPLGQQILTLWAKIKPHLTAFRDAVDQLQSNQKLRLAIIQSVWDAENSWLISEYAQRAPSGSVIEQRLVLGGGAFGPDDVQPLLEAGHADVAISYPPKKKLSFLLMHHWRNEPMVLVVARDYLQNRERDAPKLIDLKAKEGASPTLMKILHDRFYTMKEQAPMTIAVQHYLNQHKIKFDYEEPRNSVSEALSLVAQGAGISILPEPSIQWAIANKSVVAFPLRDRLYRPVAILCSRECLKKAALIAFLRCIEHHENPYPANPKTKLSEIIAQYLREEPKQHRSRKEKAVVQRLIARVPRTSPNSTS